MKALVTGAAGLLGRCLVGELAARGVRVRAFVRPGRARSLQADELLEGDLADAGDLRRAVDGVDWVFHAGARVATGGAWSEFEAVNVRATERLIEFAAAAGVARFVHVSSLGVYAVRADGETINEDSPYDEAAAERGSYARSKLLADRAAMDAARRGAPVSVVRPGPLYGPGRRPPLARRSLAVGPLRLILARPDYLLPLSHVANVADALVRAAAEPPARGRAYTVVDEQVPQARFVQMYRRLSGARWIPVYLPVGVLPALVGAAESLAKRAGRRLPVTRHQIERTLWSARFDVSRAERELGWRPRVALEEGLRSALAPAPRE